MTDTQRVLGAVRQSKTKKNAVSPAAQRKLITGWAKANGGKVVKFTEDLSTSGSTSAFKRSGLGPWLTDPDKAGSWDTLITTKLDRACRDVADYLTLRAWCDKRGKRFVIINQPLLDNATAQGRAMGTMTAVFAELEREMAKERNKERYDYLLEEGRWTGGRLPYGKRYDPDTGTLVPDDGGTMGTLDVLRAMADMAIAGKSQGQVAQWLNEHGHPPWSLAWRTVIGKQWRTDTVRRVLRADATQELLGEAKAAQLRAALRNREQTRGERTNGHMLLRVAYCAKCGGPLYAAKKDRPSGGNYRCLECGTATAMDKLEAAVEAEVLALAGDRELTGRVLVPGDDHQAAIHALEREISVLEKISGTTMVVKAKAAEIAHLRALPFDPDHYQRVPLGVTVAAHWARLATAGERGSFLREREVTAAVAMAGRRAVVSVDPGSLAAPVGDFANETELPETMHGISPAALPPA